MLIREAIKSCHRIILEEFDRLLNPHSLGVHLIFAKRRWHWKGRGGWEVWEVWGEFWPPGSAIINAPCKSEMHQSLVVSCVVRGERRANASYF